MSNKPSRPDLDLASSVMDSIKTKEVHMHSGLYFTVLTALLVMSTMFVSFLAAVLVNIFIRDLQLSREFGFGEFGPRGLMHQSSSFPWGLLVLTLVTVFATLILLRRFEFSYRHKFYIFTGLGFTSVAIFALLITVTGLADPIRKNTPLRPLATVSRSLDEHYLRGEILTIESDRAFVVMQLGRDDDGGNDDRVIRVEYTEATFAPPGFMLQEGMEIGILGMLGDDNVFVAEAFRPAKKKLNEHGMRLKGLKGMAPLPSTQ